MKQIWYVDITDTQLETMYSATVEDINAFLEANPTYRQVDDIETGFYLDADNNVHPKKDYELDNLPLPCNVVIEHKVYFCDSQPTFEFDSPGKYVITVYPPKEFMVKSFVYENFPQK